MGKFPKVRLAIRQGVIDKQTLLAENGANKNRADQARSQPLHRLQGFHGANFMYRR